MNEAPGIPNYEEECKILSEELAKTQIKLHETLDDKIRLENRIAFLEGQVRAYEFSITRTTPRGNL